MGSEAETEAISTPKLSLSSVPPKLSPKPSGMLTPPLQTSVSVPFLWEEEPGKPRPCTALITLPIPTTKCLELPPKAAANRVLQANYQNTLPTTVLDGPYVGKSVFSSLSFRFSSKRQDSFDSRSSKSPETIQMGALFLDQRKSGHKGKGLFGTSWGEKQKNLTLKGSEKELAGEDSFVFSLSSMEDALSPSDESDSSGGTKVKMAKRLGGMEAFVASPMQNLTFGQPCTRDLSRRSRGRVKNRRKKLSSSNLITYSLLGQCQSKNL